MDFKIDNLGSAVVVTLPGDHLDAGNADDFKKSMEPVLASHNQVVLDIGALQFVDSSGLGAVLSCLRKLTSKEGDLKLCNMTKQVRLLFQLVRMHRIIDVYNNRDEALASFK